RLTSAQSSKPKGPESPSSTTTTTDGSISISQTAPNSAGSGLPQKRRRRIFTRTIVTALSRTSPRNPALAAPAGKPASALAITTTTAGTISFVLFGCTTFSSGTMATALSPTSLKDPKCVVQIPTVTL